jgi:two-component system, NtrC family, sensor kinase
VANLVEASLEILRGQLRHSGIEVVQEHEPLLRISCVSSQISQVLLNLLVNAVQAIEATGRSAGKISVKSRRVESELLIEVADNGCGIDPAKLP